MKYKILNTLFCFSILFIASECIGMISAPIQNAGILPYSYNQFGDAYFLIGKERRDKNVSWWSDFGGRSNKNETPQETAVREFSEETRYVYDMDVIKNRITESAKIQYKLIDSKGVLNIYTMFLVYVDWISANIFFYKSADKHSEKTDYAWVPALKFLDAIQQSRDIRNTWYEDNFGKKLIRSHFCGLLKEDNNIEIIKKILENTWKQLNQEKIPKSTAQQPFKSEQRQDPQQVNRMLRWYYGIKSYFSTMYSSFRTFLKRNLGIK